MKERPSQLTPSKRATTSPSDTSCEIRKFDGKNFTLWKGMMQDVLIIRHHIEVIKHNNKLIAMTAEEWRSLDEITRSTI